MYYTSLQHQLFFILFSIVDLNVLLIYVDDRFINKDAFIRLVGIILVTRIKSLVFTIILMIFNPLFSYLQYP